jgi:hypothetical protein
MQIDVNSIKIIYDYSGDDAEDIARCLQNLYQTLEGTCPLDRSFGLSQDILGATTDAAQNDLAVEIIEKTEKYEPRVSVREVNFTANDEGMIQAEVILENGQS